MLELRDSSAAWPSEHHPRDRSVPGSPASSKPGIPAITTSVTTTPMLGSLSRCAAPPGPIGLQHV